MHPGNIFVLVDDPEKPRYAAVDFGIVGTLDPRDQQYLAGNFLAFFDRDYHRIAKLHIDSGWIPPETRIDELETAVRSVCDPIFNKPLSEISFAEVMISLFETARRFNMVIQPQLILLQKTLFNIEGLGRQLYPELDLWKTAHPILRQWMADQVGPGAALQQLKEDLPQIRDSFRQLPGIVRYLSEQIENDSLKIGIRSPELAEIRERLAAGQRQRFLLATAATAVISGTLIVILAATTWPGWTLVVAGAALAFAGRPRG